MAKCNILNAPNPLDFGISSFSFVVVHYVVRVNACPTTPSWQMTSLALTLDKTIEALATMGHLV